MKLPATLRPHTSAGYRGRFAPSPSGLLHFGSLVAALASFLDAKSNQGKWLIRIEDIDPPREKVGAGAAILKTLTSYGLLWDEEVLYQSQQSALYDEILNELEKANLSYRCQCTRAEIKKQGGIYLGTCKTKNISDINSAVRLINGHGIFQYQDLIQSKVQTEQALAAEDFILRRKDGLYAYQLAVVVDDIYQGISHVIRGCDLLQPTARQLSFYQTLQCSPPKFGHFPLAVTQKGFKLSKQNKATAIDDKNPLESLIHALEFLGQQPPSELAYANVDELLCWAISQWSINKIPQQKEIVL